MLASFIDSLKSVPLIATAIIVLGLALAHWLLIRRSRDMGAGKRFHRQLSMVGLTGLAMVILLFILTDGKGDLRSHVFTVFGIIVSVALGISSTTFVSNAMAGLLVRLVRNFRRGDFIRVCDQFGRVTEKGLFHTEIQTEDRDLVTLPNLFVVTNPVRVIRSSGTVVSVNLSLGYDLPRNRVEELLKGAARDAELADAFVHITELGDYSIGYRVSGFLTEIKQLRAARSNLRKTILDRLHGAGIEIVSPAFMNQRPLDPQGKVIPERTLKPKKPDLEKDEEVEAIIFDKADEAEAKEMLHIEHDQALEKIETLKKTRHASKDDDECARLDTEISELESRVSEIAEEIKQANGKEESE